MIGAGIGGGGTNSNTITVNTGATLQFTHSYTHASGSNLSGAGTVTTSGGTHSFPAGTFNPTGTVNLSGGTTTINNTFMPASLGAISGGTITFNASQSFASLSFSSGTIGGSGDLTLTNMLNWSGGIMSGAGQTIIAPGATLNMSSASTKDLRRILQNDGTANWSEGEIRGNGSTFTNNGSFNASVPNNVGYRSDSGTNTFVNNGSFVRSGTGAATFTVNGGGSITFDNSGSVHVQSGTLTLSGGVTQHVGTVLTGGTWNATDATLNITTGSNITTNQANVTLDGSASVFARLNSLSTNSSGGSFTIRGGRNFASLGALSNSGTIAVGTGSVLTVPGALNNAVGTIDLNGALIIDYSAPSSPLADVQGWLISGYASGAWNGSGIKSSVAATTPNRALGYAESADLFSTFPASFAGQSVDNTAVLIRYTRYGDANLDGTVNLADFNRLAAAFGQSNTVWSQGNFNYDSTTNLTDFNQLAANFGQSAGSASVGGRGEVQTLETLREPIMQGTVKLPERFSWRMIEQIDDLLANVPG
jgi:hypothetical protein